MTNKLDVELSAELEPYRSAIEATIKPYIEIKLTDNSNPTWWQSKFGGLPYMPQDFDYPKSNDGEYLYLLAQINFAEVPELKGLPDQGILQFYLADDDIYGYDYDNPTRQDKFRVIYFPEISLIEQDLVTDFSFLSQPKEHCFPLYGCSSLTFKINYAPITGGDYKFFNVFGEDDFLDKAEEEYWEKFNDAGHKLLGYPDFTQEDPRYLLETDERYILLLQIDSDRKNNIQIMWGDMGIANFFIKQSDLEKLDFSNVLYNWDCT